MGGDPLIDVIDYRVIHLRQHIVNLLFTGREHPCVGCQLTAYGVCLGANIVRASCSGHRPVVDGSKDENKNEIVNDLVGLQKKGKKHHVSHATEIETSSHAFHATDSESANGLS